MARLARAACMAASQCCWPALPRVRGPRDHGGGVQQPARHRPLLPERARRAPPCPQLPRIQSGEHHRRTLLLPRLRSPQQPESLREFLCRICCSYPSNPLQGTTPGEAGRKAYFLPTSPFPLYHGLDNPQGALGESIVAATGLSVFLIDHESHGLR